MLNNPWVVLGLCAGAVLLYILRAPEFTSEAPTGSSLAAPPRSSGLSTTTDSASAEPVVVQVAKSEPLDETWPNTVARDPFAPVRRGGGHAEDMDRPQTLGGPDASSTSSHVISVPPPLQLHAVALEPRPKTAVINRTFVREGDDIEGQRVVRIQADGVWMRGPAGEQRLVFDVSSRKSHAPEYRSRNVRPRR